MKFKLYRSEIGIIDTSAKYIRPILFSLIFALSNCGSDVKVVEEEYHLLPSSIDRLPYEDVETVVFRDSVRNFLFLVVSEDPLDLMTMTEPWSHEDIETGERTDYYYSSGLKTYLLVNDEYNLEFRVQLKAEPFKGLSSEGEVKDELAVMVKTNGDKNQNHQRSYTHVFEDIVDPRNYPGAEPESPFDSMTFLGRTFAEVFPQNSYQDNQLFLHFNYEFGIISFCDSTGNLWCFEGFVYKNEK